MHLLLSASILLLDILVRLPKLALKPWIRDKAARLILRNAKIINPSEGTLLTGLHDVVTDDGLIISMCPSIAEQGAKLDIADANPKDPKPFIVDLSGRYLCP